MSDSRILTVPNQKLRGRAKKVTQFNDELKKLSGELVEIMRTYDGVGLAAPQIDLPLRMITLEYQGDPKDKEKPKEKPFPLAVLVNPVVTKLSKDLIDMDEGCLSLPDLELLVTRPKEVNVVAQDIEGKRIKIRAKGLFARVLQHEIDHLDGVLFTDRAKGVKDLKNYRKLHIVFMGTPEFAVPILVALEKKGLTITAVITEPDKPAGRGQEMVAPAVKAAAEKLGLTVIQPETTEELTHLIGELKPHYIVLAAYGKILPQKLLEIPPYGVINIHPSMLPKYRGATPIQAVILNREDKTGVTIMRLDEKMDHGPIISQKEVVIEKNETAESLRLKLAEVGANLLISCLAGYLGNQIRPKVQDDDEATFTKLLKKEDGLINWADSAEKIERQVRAYNPWPRAYTMVDGKRLIIHEAHLENGKLVPDIIQLEGKNKTSWEDFKRGWRGNLPKELL